MKIGLSHVWYSRILLTYWLLNVMGRFNDTDSGLRDSKIM